MLLLLVILFGMTSAYELVCHCLNGANCHANGFCVNGCEEGWFGPGCQIGNLAINMKAYQSSTFTDTGYTPAYIHNASLAVDGILPSSNEYNQARSCSHTTPRYGGGSAWWYVVLSNASNFFITNITLVNRKDRSAQRRLTNFIILYSNETEGDPNQTTWNKCAREMGTVSTSQTYTCNSTAVAKRVAVFLIYNSEAILSLCEVRVYGYQQFICPSGYTGPGCLLRSCDQCRSTEQQCTAVFDSCHYSVCPDQSLLPPDCWITLSNYSDVNIQTVGTCSKLHYSFDLPRTQPNIAASSLQLQVSTPGGQMVVNSTILLQGVSSPTFTYDNATADTLYEVSVKPVYCGNPYSSCFYATPSKAFTHSTGKREYVFSHNITCVFVNVTSATPDCEPPTKVQVTCQSDNVDSVAVSSSSLSTCGLERGREYNCSLAATVNANMIETHSERIVTELLPSSPAPKQDIAAVAGGIGGAVALLVVIFAIIIVLYFRRQRNAMSRASDIAQDASVKSRAAAGALDVAKLPSIHEEQSESPYEPLNMELAMQTTGDYASLK